MIQAGLVDEMNPAEYKIARLLIDHPEYEDTYDDEELLDGREFDTDPEGNPFLHISVHKMVEDQIETGRPEEVTLYLGAMVDRGFDRHAIIHAIMKILVRLIADAVNKQKALDVKRYRGLLGRYRNIGLDEVAEALDREFASH
jgi:hypothetical protein